MLNKDELSRMLMGWRFEALRLLRESLLRPQSYSDVLEWRVSWDEENRSLAKHLSAFANRPKGGFLVFGLLPDGAVQGILSSPFKDLIKRIDSVARKSLRPPVRLEHSILQYEGQEILVYYVKEGAEKPVYLRGGGPFESFLRASGRTRQMDRMELARIIAQGGCDPLTKLNLSSGDFFEQPNSLEEIDIQGFFRLRDEALPSSMEDIKEALRQRGVLQSFTDQGEMVSSVGAVLYGRDLRHFKVLKEKTIKLTVYGDGSRSNIVHRDEFAEGYSLTLSKVCRAIRHASATQFSSLTDVRLRTAVDTLIEHLLINALVHQDFASTDGGPMIDVFTDRIEFSNPGVCTVDISRIVDAQEVRNLSLFTQARELKMVLGAGSGVDQVVELSELLQLPPPLFYNSPNSFHAVLYGARPLNRMDKEDRLRAIYQHACLRAVRGKLITNQSVRERLGIKEQNYSMVSRYIAMAVDAQLIKPTQPKSGSRRFASYAPFWA